MSEAVVDMAAIESQKENILPLPQGRSAAALVQALDSQQEPAKDSTDDQLKARKERDFEQRLAAVTGEEDDPLEPFVAYVTWVQSAYPSGRSAALMKTVEKCVRRFKNDVRYRNDPRFLRLWLLVAHQAREPIDVFKYLSVNKIGSELALYYEEYANYLEKSSRNKEAMEVYTLGIGRKAAPLERLSRHFAEFQRRMVCVSSTGVSEEEPRAPVVKPSASSSSSSSVGTKKSLISSSRDSKSVAASKGKGNGQRFQVFCDDEQEDDSAANQEVLLPSASSANAWKEYGNEKSRTKENYVEPTPWAGQTLKQTKGAPRMEKIHVFQDEEGPEDNNNPSVSHSGSKSNSNTLGEKPVIDASPFYLSEEPRVSPGSLKPAKQSSAATAKSSKKPEKMMFNLDAVYQNGQEFSFEELRAKQIGFKYSEPVQEDSKPVVIPVKSPIRPMTRAVEPPARHMPSPTINTKAAMQDVFEMFNQPLAEQQDWDYEDETISAKVYRPEQVKIGVFKDSDDEEDEQEQRRVTPPSSVSSMSGSRNVRADEYEVNLEDSERFPFPAKTPKMPPKYPISSTPLVPSGMTSAPQTVMRPGFKPFVDIMTPITEVSEDRTFAGLSTIHSERNLIASLSSCEDSTGSTQSFLSRHKKSLGGDILTDLGEHTEMLRLDSIASMDQTEMQSDDVQDQQDLSRSLNQGPAQIMPVHTDEDLTGYEMMDIPNPCNPRDPQIIQAILESVDIPRDIGLYPCMNQAAGFLSRFGRCLSLKGKKRSASQNPSEDDSNILVFDLPKVGKFKFSKKLGEGGFGSVFLVQRLNAGSLSEAELLQALEDEEGADLDANVTMDGTMTSLHTTPMALKIESPPAPWEFYILSLLRSRLPVRVNESVMRPVSCHLFQDESAFLMEFLNQGTLLNCVNLAQKGGYGASSGTGPGGLDELLAMFWAIEILRTVETAHAAGIMHGDIKPDNCMVRLGDSEEDWESLYQASGDGGWSSKGMMLVDWGSAIDILSFPEDQRFCSSRIGVKPDPSIECWEVRHDRSWTYELDWYAVAGVIHVLLFGTYMEVVEEDDGTDIPRLALASHFKRYWQADLWKDLFDLLLNSGRLNAAMLVEGQDTTESLLNSLDAGLVGPGTDFEVLEQEFPIVKNIHSKRMELEAWLKENSCKSGKSLRNLLRRVEITLLEHNK